MIQQQQTLIASPYIELYNLVVPQDNMLRQINELIDFSFVYDELKNQYCLDNGRNAIDPIRMFKYLLLKAIFELSDVEIVDKLINQTVKIAIEKGIIQSKAIIVDATHTKARYNRNPREKSCWTAL